MKAEAIRVDGRQGIGGGGEGRGRGEEKTQRKRKEQSVPLISYLMSIISTLSGLSEHAAHALTTLVQPHGSLLQRRVVSKLIT